MTQWLQGYEWDGETRRYRSGKTGRFVARDRITDLMDRSLHDREKRLLRGVQRFGDGDISAGAWYSRTSTMLQRQHLQNAALAAGGWDRLTPAQLEQVQARLTDDLVRLVEFGQGIKDGTVSAAQAANRMHMYLGSARREYYDIEKTNRMGKPGLVTMAKRTLGAAEHCEDCVMMAAWSWLPAEEVPIPGEASACDGNCRCEIEYRDVPMGTEETEEESEAFDPDQPRDEATTVHPSESETI